MALQTTFGNKYYLVVVADESRATTYLRDKLRSPLRQQSQFDNESARMKTGDLISDRGGRSFDSHGQGRHTMTGEKSDPKKHLAEVFARQIADHIATEMHQGSCKGYALVAAPKFLGMLRAQLASRVSADPYATVDKNVVGQSAEVIAGLLDEL